MKKNFIVIALLALLSTTLTAQQLPIYAHLYFMRMLYNPALTAYNSSSNVYGFYREQWNGLPGHPVTRGAMGEISLWKDRSGVGFHVYNDKTDIINRINAQVYYAQKVHIAKDHIISLGISLGIMNTNVDFGSIRGDLTDQYLAAGNGAGFDMNIGLAYQWKRLTIGFAVPHVALSTAKITQQIANTTVTAERHYVASISYDFGIKKDKWGIEPSVVFKKGSGDPIQLDINVMANYKKVVFFGMGYRLDYGISGQAAVRISRAVTIGYAYEYPIMSKTSYANTNGTHEVIFGLNFDRWLKNEKKLHELEKKVKDLDEARKGDSAKVEGLDSKNKQLAKDVDDAKTASKANGDKIKELETRVDSFEKAIQDYKNHVAQSPVTRFDGSNPMNDGDIYKMETVNFETNSSSLKPESYTELDKLVKMMQTDPTMKVKVLGHTDYIASENYNQWLSEKRAKRVADYLISKGVAAGNISSIGFGKRAPIADNTTEEGRAKNRRVEIQVRKK